MKKFILSASVVAAMFAATNAKAQLVDEQNVTVTMDLQPILQLGMNGNQNLDFVFDQISEYVGGITQYGATQLSVSSSVSWDLYAVGFSSTALSTGNLNWDNPVSYGSGDPASTTSLPLYLLELHQSRSNPSGTVGAGVDDDYFTAFQSGSTSIGANNVYASSSPYTRPVVNSKYIAGGESSTNFVAGFRQGSGIPSNLFGWYPVKEDEIDPHENTPSSPQAVGNQSQACARHGCLDARRLQVPALFIVG